jgi:hypothetical protein
MIRRRALALASAVLLLSCPVAFAQGKEQQTRKLSKDEQKEFTTITTLLNSAQAPANDLGMSWDGNEMLKAQGNNEFVPFTVTLDGSKLSDTRFSLYWRVVSKDAPPPDPKAKKDSKAIQEFAAQNLHTVTVASKSGTLRLSRSFVVPAGEYDVIVLAKEADPKKKGDPAAKLGFVKQSVSVADLWNGEFTTGSVIVAERMDPLPAPLTPSQIEERPYAAVVVGNEIVAAKNPRLTKRGELTVFVPIYNAKLGTTGSPDVMVEYNFYISQNGAEKFFNKTQPQAFNAQTVPAGTDAAAGLPGGQTIPLSSFPEGQYRLEMKITDKLATKSLTREARFSVSGS